MEIEIKLFASFRENRFSKKRITVSDDITVSDIITDLEIAQDEVGVTMINGRHCSMESKFTEGDSLGIFPMIGGG